MNAGLEMLREELRRRFGLDSVLINGKWEFNVTEAGPSNKAQVDAVTWSYALVMSRINNALVQAIEHEGYEIENKVGTDGTAYVRLRERAVLTEGEGVYDAVKLKALTAAVMRKGISIIYSGTLRNMHAELTPLGGSAMPRTEPTTLRAVHGVEVPQDAVVTLDANGEVRMSMDDLRKLFLSATLRASPAKVD